jgi:hypothetical protein
MALGRENMSPHHCMYCETKTSEMGDLDKNGDALTMQICCNYGEMAILNEKPYKGMKKLPWWIFIPLINWAVPILHCLIGIGNDLIYAYMCIVNTHIEPLTKDEIETRREIAMLEILIKNTRATKKAWDDSADGKRLKALNRKTKVVASTNEVQLEQSESVDDIDDNDNDQLEQSESVDDIDDNDNDQLEQLESVDDIDDNDDDVDDDDDEGGGLWELTKIYSVKELKKVKPTRCMTKKCNLVACSRWVPIEGGDPWDTCLDCQAE